MIAVYSTAHKQVNPYLRFACDRPTGFCSLGYPYPQAWARQSWLYTHVADQYLHHTRAYAHAHRWYWSCDSTHCCSYKFWCLELHFRLEEDATVIKRGLEDSNTLKGEGIDGEGDYEKTRRAANVHFQISYFQVLKEVQEPSYHWRPPYIETAKEASRRPASVYWQISRGKRWVDSKTASPPPPGTVARDGVSLPTIKRVRKSLGWVAMRPSTANW